MRLAGYFLLLMLVVLLPTAGGASAEPERGRFRLHRDLAYPLLEYNGRCYWFDWYGHPLFITPHRLVKEYWVTTDTEGRSLDVLPAEIRERIEKQVMGDVSYVTLGPSVPDGWRRAVAVTTGFARGDELKPHHGDERDAAGIYGWVFDADNGQLLAELDLVNVAYQLGKLQVESLQKVYVRSVAAGPDGGMGLEFMFTADYGVQLRCGVWDGSSWKDSRYKWDGSRSTPVSLYIGPDNRLLRVTENQTVQFLPASVYRQAWWAEHNKLVHFRHLLIRRVIELAIMIAIPALLVVIMQVTLWYFLPKADVKI